MNNSEEYIVWSGALKHYCGRVGAATASFIILLHDAWFNLSRYTRFNLLHDLQRLIDNDELCRSLIEHGPFPLGGDKEKEAWFDLYKMMADDKDIIDHILDE